MKLQLGADFDAEGLDEAEYDDTDFPSYDGPLPRSDTVLLMRLTRAWATESSHGDLMFKTILVCEKGEFEGLTIWDNITFTEAAAFRFRPFLDAFGLTAKMIKRSTIVDDDEGRFGNLIRKIGKWEPGSDDALVLIKVKHGKTLDGEPRAEAGKYIRFEEGEEPDEEEAAPAARKAAPAARKAAPVARKAAKAAAPDDEDDGFLDEPPF